MSEIDPSGFPNVTVSGGASLSGITQGHGSHVAGQILNGAQMINGVLPASGTVAEAEYRIVVQTPGGITYAIVGFNIREPGQPSAFGTIAALAFIGHVGGYPRLRCLFG
jgi:hypothetical protein